MRTRKSINTGAFVFRSSLARKEYTDAITGGITALTMLEAAEALGAEARFAFAATPQTTLGTDTTYTVDYETLYMVKDHLGSIRAITDSQGNILERNDYYPYGLQTDFGRNYPAIAEKYRVKLPAYFSDYNHNNNGYTTISSATEKLLPYRLLYNGKELQMMAQTRLIDYGARQYDPTIARWNAPDPMSEKYMTLTTYNYCAGNPILLTDLKGLDNYRYDKKTGDFILMETTNDEVDQVLNYRNKPNKESGEYELRDDKILIGNIEKGILKDGINFKENHNIISLTENGPSVKGIEEFVIGLSEMVGVEISGYEYTYKGNENISNIFICRYRSSKDRPSRWNTQTKAHSPLDLKLIGAGLDGIDVITHFHTHLSTFSLYNRLNPSGLEDGTGDIQFKKNQEIFGIKNFIILTKGYPRINY